jgi:undecaprenyl diphosphate synthase
MFSIAPMQQCTVKKYYSHAQLSELDLEQVPRHVAIIMDGNRRWAQRSAKNYLQGHTKGADILIDILKAGKELGIKVMTLYVFSTENWNRPKAEVAALMWLYESYIRKQIPEMVEQRIRFDTIGDIARLPSAVQEAIAEAKQMTSHCECMEVVFAMNYGSRDEIRRAIQKMAKDIQAGLLTEETISEKTITSYLDTASYPDPDLLIRTSGEHRISNFLLWQLSYAEVYVTPTLWPDFAPSHLLQALIEFQNRERRIGR